MVIIVHRAITVALAVLFTLVSAVSCNTEEEAAPVAAPAVNIPERESGTLAILNARGEIGQYLQQAAALFAEENGGIKISVHTVANPADYETTLRARLLSGERADLFQIGEPGISNPSDAERYNAEDLSSLPWLSEAMPGSLDAVTKDGAVYGVPYSIEGTGLIVNLDIFRKAGIYFGNRPTLESLDEVFGELAAAENPENTAVRDKEDENGETDETNAPPAIEAVTGFASANGEYLRDTASAIFLAGSYENLADAAYGSYLDPAGNESAEGFFRLMADYSAGGADGGSEQLEALLAAGKVAAIFGGTEAYTRIKESNPAIADGLAFFPIPIGTEEEGKTAVFTGVPAYWCVHAESTPQAKGKAREFLTWLYRTESGAKIYTERFAALSPFPGRGESANPLHGSLLRHIGEGNSLPALSPGAPDGWKDVFASGVQGYFSSAITWEQMSEDCVTAWYDARTDEILSHA